MVETDKIHKIMLVEDSDNYGILIKTILNKNFGEIQWMKNGQEAYKAFKSGQNVDLLITDVMMPIMDGFELLTLLKKEGILPLTIVMTAKKGEENVLKGLNLGATDFIAKPFNPGDFLARVKIHLKRNP